MTLNPPKHIYERLREVGFTKLYIQKVAALPTWWEDSLWNDPASNAVGLMHLSRHLGIDIASLQDTNSTLRLKDFGICKYKRREGTTEDDLLLARVIATRAAQLTIAAMDTPLTNVLPAREVRNKILESASWVDFETLLDYCWNSGIPVIHVNNFPSDAKKKPMGFTLRVNGRPAIVLCEAKLQPAWHLFILAHELGHLHHNHVPENGALMDETAHENLPDDEEKQADQYALELLTGNAKACFVLDRLVKADEFARQAKSFGERNKIDPGHAILNCAYNQESIWPLANAALKVLTPNADAVGMVRDRVAANLDWEKLPEDSSEFLMRITKQESVE